MRRLFGALAIAVSVLLIGASTAEACYCGALRYRCGRGACRSAADCTCCQQCYTVMKTCQQVVYEPREVTAYKVVYEEVVEKKTVDAVKYVEETRYRYAPTTILQPRAVPCCEPVEGCAPVECCQPAACCQMVPVQCIQKVPYTAYKPVPYQKTEEVPRTVIKQVPYTVTCYEPKVVCVQVPVEVCCPVPCCCKAKCCAPEGCGG